MSLDWKICDNCQHKVNIDDVKCPFCGHEFNDESPSNPEVRELYEYCDLIDSRGDYSKTPLLEDIKSRNGSVKSLVKKDLADFLVYVACEGQSQCDEKIEFIKDNLGVEATFDGAVFNKNDLPDSFRAFHENDLFHRDFLEKNNLEGYTNKLFGIYRSLGDEFLKCGDTQPKAFSVLNEYINNLAHSISQFKRNYDLGANPADKKRIEEVLNILIGCKSVDDVDGDVICDARNFINASVSGNDEYTPFYDELSEKRPDVVASIIISSSSDYIFQSDDKSGEPVEDEQTLEELLEELNKLVGLEKVKKDVNSLINLVQIRKIRSERGMKQPPMSLHLVFSGNPGTGKTTVARLLSKIYCKLGVISKGHLVETDRSGLVGGYLGQTAIKTQEVIQSAMGGILFIDEAYTLAPKSQDDAYGQEAIDTILKAMEDHRDDLIVIVAGYPDLMDNFIHSNPGLESRFNKYIFFEDYNPEELHGIFLSMCENSTLKLDDKADKYLKGLCEDIYNTRGDNFANARQIRNIFENVLTAQANRLSDDDDITDDELMTILLEDFES
ncbi:AAA family ATPase [Methanobrevibacter sp.]|uniref:AAA family ATPase n=1 Tax=Methanobrevibacter sp. TaxID=66852 RepID=UPI00388F4091